MITPCYHPFFIFTGMKNYLLVILITITAYTATAQSNPEWLVYPGTPTAGRFDDIFFINDSVGWAVSSDGLIVKTVDYGIHWVPKFSSSTYFRSVEFFDASTGFAGTLFGNLYKTTDGGDSWVDIGAALPESFTGICGLSVADDSTIYACGIWSSPAYIFKSTDRGETWTYMDMNALAYSLVDIKFTDKDHGFATGQSANLSQGGIILYTENGGADWEVKTTTGHPNDYVWKIQLLDGVHAFGAIADVTGTGTTRFLKSLDNGDSWEVKLISADYTYIEMIGFMNADTGWTGSYDIYETFDGGETWHFSPWGYNMNRFYKVNDNFAVASGETIYIYTDTAAIIVDTLTTIHQPELLNNILSITPNPASDKITIEYSIHAKTTADISIYNMLGQLQLTISHGIVQAGNYTVQQPIPLPPGSYVLCLHANEGLSWKKFVVQ